MGAWRGSAKGLEQGGYDIRGRRVGRGYLAAKGPAANERGAKRAIFSSRSLGCLISLAGSRQAAMETLRAVLQELGPRPLATPIPGLRTRPALPRRRSAALGTSLTLSERPQALEEEPRVRISLGSGRRVVGRGLRF